jgi:hypothetical protein
MINKEFFSQNSIGGRLRDRDHALVARESFLSVSNRKKNPLFTPRSGTSSVPEQAARSA